jgi:phosphate transport system protein
MRSKLDEQLARINTSLIEMGGIVEKAITNAIKALYEQDMTLARINIASDDEVDDKEKEIETLCLQLILQQQPIANDLRLVSAVLKIITDLERIGDHAADISEIILMLGGKPYIKNLDHISQMADETMTMLNRSIDAYVKRDIAHAREVIAYDDVVDDLFDTVKKDLVVLIHDDPVNGDQAIDLIMIAKYFERIGDHATNISERVIFALTGTHKDIKIM